LLELLETLLSDCFTCLKRNTVSSCVFGIDFRDRQGSVGLLSRFLFAVYLDDLGKLCNSQIGCFVIFVLFLLLFLRR